MEKKKSKLRFLAHCSLILLLILLLLPATGCHNTGCIYCYATLDGELWEGPLYFTITSIGGLNESGSSVPYRTRTDLQVGVYVVTYKSGGPQGADIRFSGIRYIISSFYKTMNWDNFTDSTTANVKLSSRTERDESLTDRAEVYFTFVSVGKMNVDATLDGAPWSGPVDYTLDGPETETGVAVPQNFPEVSIGTYTATCNSGGPPNAVFSGTSPLSAEVSTGETTALTLNFVSTGGLTVSASLDDDPWSGAVNYTIDGSVWTETADSAPWSFSDLPVGTYTATYNSGGPSDAIFNGTSPLSAEVSAGGIATLILEFVSSGDITVNATLDGDPWEGEVNYTLDGPRTEAGELVPQDFNKYPVGTYTVTYVSDGPTGAVLKEIVPSDTEELSSGGTTKFTLVFVSTAAMTGRITVNARLNQQSWEGPVSYTVNGPDTESGSVVPQNFTDFTAGTYTVAYDGGGPDGAVFCGVSPPTAYLYASGAATLTLVFGYITFEDLVAEQSCDLSVDKVVDNAAPNQNSNVTYTVTVANAGPDIATNVVVTDNLPAGVIYVNDNPSQGAYNSDSGVWTVGTINVGGNATLQITATVNAGAGETVTNTAELTSFGQTDPDSTPNNHVLAEDDQDTAAFTMQSADLSLTKTVNYPLRSQGEDITYTITVTNNGPDAATNVVVTDNLPAGVTYVNGNPSQGAYNNVTGIWTVGNIASGGNATLEILVTVNAAPATVITNSAEVTSVDQPDPDSTPDNDVLAEDDQDTAVTTVQGGAD